MQGKVDVVVVTFNSKDCIGAALSSTRRCMMAGLVERCIVVDNASQDGTAAFIRDDHDWCTLVASRDNLGFGPACNLAFERTSAPYVLLLNPDAHLTPAALAELVAFLDREDRAGAVGPAIKQPDGRWQFAGGVPNPGGVRRLTRGAGPVHKRQTIEPGQPPFRTDWLCGAVVLVRRRMWQELGGFDPQFFLYFEETDLWARARQKGWQLWTVGAAVAEHVQGASARQGRGDLVHGCLAEHYYRSRYRYLCKHHGWLAASVAEIGDLTLLAGRAARHALTGGGLHDLRVRLRAPVLGRTLAEWRS